MKNHRLLFLVAAVSCVGLVGWLSAADDKPAKPAEKSAAPAAAPAVAPASASGGQSAGPSSEEVMRRLSDKLQANPVIEPSTQATTKEPDAGPVGSVASVAVDPNIIGVAPDSQSSPLRREGEFVIQRRGRLVRAPSGGHILFAFDADNAKAGEPPVILIPCLMLQSMEELVADRGDKIVFIVSGQITTYRGANFMLPTMMKLAVDKGNLQN